MLFSKSRFTEDIEIIINNTEITRVSETKLLGVWIDEKLNWKHHISYVKTKVSRGLFMLNRAKHVLNHDAMLILYNTLVLPHLTYCREIWGNTYTSNLQGVVTLQKRIVRLIHGAAYNAHTNMLFYGSKILKFHDLVQLSMAVVMHKAYNSTLPPNIQNLFSIKLQNESKMTTRQTNKFIQPRPRTTLKSMCISIRGVKLWNSLDSEIINTNKSLHRFKKAVKQHYLNRYNNMAQ